MPESYEASFRNHQLTFCSSGLLEPLQRFLDIHWQRGHALTKSRALLDWQHKDRLSGSYNFVLALDGSSSEIDGVLGFIPTSQFDETLSERRDVWLAIWKVREDKPTGGLGIALLDFLSHALPAQSVSAIGLNDAVIPLYRMLGFRTGQMEHHYIVNEKCHRFKLLDGFTGVCHGSLGSDAVQFDPLVTEDDVATFYRELAEPLRAPKKTAVYLQRRYLQHPIYHYSLYGLTSPRGRGIVVTRTCSHAGSRALRFVDFLGDPDALVGGQRALQALLEERQAEYGDFYSVGIDAESFRAAGFLRRPQSSKVIVPNYFEPFERQNVDLAYAMRGQDLALFKGDSDQDRPNSV